MQLHLSFLDVPVPEDCVWDRLSCEQKILAIQSISKLIIKAIVKEQEQGELS
jgi:hypothetical protein